MLYHEISGTGIALTKAYVCSNLLVKGAKDEPGR